jgi:HAD superfamily hydrolase (TIGR01544 family)
VGIEFLETLDKANIPVVIMSASGLWEDSIALYLEKHLSKNNKIHIISNGFVWDENEIAIKHKEPIITSLSKDETVISQENFPEIYTEISKRKNLILLGDQIDDIDMLTWFDHDTVLKIWFLNDPSDEKIKIYQDHFDIILLWDSGMEEINKILKTLL